MKQIVISVAVIIGFGVCSVYVYNRYTKWKSRIPPKKWKKVGNVTKLYIYPLKSGRYIEQNTIECGRFGFSILKDEDSFQLKDRHFLVYGEQDLVGKSARIYPRMVLIAISSHNINHITLEAPEMEQLCVKVPIKSKSIVKTIQFQSWSDEFVPTIDCGNEASKWLSRFLLQKDSGLCLGYHDISSYRTLKSFKDKEPQRFYKYLSDSVFGLYSDLAALLLLNEKTFYDLNEKLEKKVTRLRFRPNIVVDGPEINAFDEDTWFWLKIGGTIVRNVSDCTRCVLTTVDPETGIRDIGREPLKTLSKYRISNGPSKGPIMGVNLEVVVPGIIRVDDEVLVGVEE